MLFDGIKMLPGTDIVNQDNSDFTGAAVYDIAGYTLSQPTDAAVISRFRTPRAFTLPAGLTDSEGGSGVAPTGAVSYPIKKNGSQVGTMDFGAGSNSATFTMATETSFAIGDLLTVEAPATADATHDEIAFTLVATLV